MAQERKLPTLFESRPVSMQVVLAVVVPAVLGAVAGLTLSPLPGLYIAIQVVAALGGIVAGLEHRRYGQAALRGLGAGLCYGIPIYVLYKVLGGNAHHLIGQRPVLLPLITAVFGALFAAIGCFIRSRLEGPRP
jgi:hypothetical protein